MSAICQCSHHRFTHNYYDDEWKWLWSNSRTCLANLLTNRSRYSNCEVCECLEYKSREKRDPFNKNEIASVAGVRLNYKRIVINDLLKKYRDLEYEDDKRIRREHDKGYNHVTPTHVYCPFCSLYSVTYDHIIHIHLVKERNFLDDDNDEDFIFAYTRIVEYEEEVRKRNEKLIEDFKISKTCRLFRCLVCWGIIAQDENIRPYKKGYVHAVCVRVKGSGKKKTNKDKLKCANCNHTKLVHIKEKIGRKVIDKCSVMIYDKELAIHMHMKGDNPPSKMCSCKKFIDKKL